MENPFPNGLTPLLGASKGLLTFFDPAGGVISMQHDMPNTTTYNWNFGIQRMLPGAVLISTSYVGSTGLHFPTGTAAINPLDQLPRATALKFGKQLIDPQKQVPNPFFGIVHDPSSPLSQPTIQLWYLLTPYPQFAEFPFLTYSPLNGHSSYHAFQLRAEKSLSKGLNFLLSYTGSKNLDNGEGTLFATGSHSAGPQDNYNYRLEKALAGQDVSRRLVFSYIYELPVGAGKRFHPANPVLDALAGGWQTNGILTLSNGIPVVWGYLPLDPTLGYPFELVARPNETCDPVLMNPTPERYFNTSCFADPPSLTLGTAPRSDPHLRMPGVRQLDMSVFKNFAVTESLRAQFRAEFFNLTNTPRLFAPQGTFGPALFSTFGASNPAFPTGAFGELTSQANDPRKIQFGLKLNF